MPQVISILDRRLRSILARDFLARHAGFPQRKKKGPKKKESLLKLPQLWKSTKVASGDIFLMISTAA
jgi:hypothetical protein